MPGSRRSVAVRSSWLVFDVILIVLQGGIPCLGSFAEIAKDRRARRGLPIADRKGSEQAWFMHNDQRCGCYGCHGYDEQAKGIDSGPPPPRDIRAYK